VSTILATIVTRNSHRVKFRPKTNLKNKKFAHNLHPQESHCQPKKLLSQTSHSSQPEANSRMRSKPRSVQEHLEVVPPSNDHKNPQNKTKQRKKRKKENKKAGKNNRPRPRTKLSTTKTQTLKPSLPTEAAEGKQQQQHQDHDRRLLRHAAYQKHPYPCDYDRAQRSRSWSPRETSPYPLPPPRAPPKKGLSFHKLAHCESSRHIELTIIVKYSIEFNLPESLEVVAWSQAAFLGSLLAWLGLAWLGFVCTGAASDATVRDKKNSLTWEKINTR
jgi:hypothetical protein